jgi:hypothetical protein
MTQVQFIRCFNKSILIKISLIYETESRFSEKMTLSIAIQKMKFFWRTP